MGVTIVVDDETWSRLTVLKARGKYSDLDQVVRELLGIGEEKLLGKSIFK